jgi:hypothetical protein
MLTLGFSSMYYTLWEVGEPKKRYTSGAMVNGVFTGSYYMEQECVYLQNLSIDYDSAVKKIEHRSGGKYSIDLDLKGHSTFIRSCGITGNDMPDCVFSFGQLAGQDIRTATDVWQIKRAMKEERGGRRRAYARRRLIELGELVRNAFEGDNYITPAHFKYLSEKAEKANKSGHFFENGSRVTLLIKRIGGASWPVQFGYRESVMYLEEYVTEAGQLIKYKGSSPLDIGDEFVEVIGTVEHSEYNGHPETRLKRMKMANKKAA